MEFFDSHCHLDHVEFDDDRDAMIARAKAAGVTRMLTIGPSDGIESSRRAIALARQHDGVWATAGIHPHDVARDFSFDELRALAQEPEVVAVGEIGLDFYRDWSPYDLQEKFFRLQIELALEVKKPLIIHSRSAGAQCIQILREHHAEDAGGVFHCYAEDAAFARELRDLNFSVSFPGSLTFKNAAALREIAAAIPIDQILIETDAPFMAPVPHRGKRCESAYLPKVAEQLAALKGLSVEEVAAQTTRNAMKRFRVS